MKLPFFKDELVKNIASVISTRVLLKGINFLSIFILLQYLTPSDMGLYGIFISSVVLATTIGNLGFKNATAIQIGAGEDKNLIVNVLRHVYPVLAFVTVIAVFAIYWSSDYQFDSILLVALTIVAVLCHLAIVLRQGICLGGGEISLFNLLEIIPRSTLLIGVSLVVFIWEDIDKLAAVSAITAGYFLAFVWSVVRTPNIPIENIKPHIYRFFKIGFPFCAALTLIMLNFNLPIYLSNMLYDESVAGQVFTALRINDIFLELATAAGLIIFSHSARNKSSHSFKKIIKTMVIVVGVSFVVVVFVNLSASYLIGLVTKGNYDSAVDYLKIISFGLPFVAFNKMAYGYVSGVGKPKFGIWIYIFVVSINVLITAFLQDNGVEFSVVYALVTSQIVAAVLFFICMFREGKKIHVKQIA